MFKNVPYMAIAPYALYFGTTGSAAHDRQELMIYKFVDNLPKEVTRLCNANGINYCDIIEHITDGSKTSNRNRLYMTFSEDRRKIYTGSPYRQFSNLATIDITNYILEAELNMDD